MTEEIDGIEGNGEGSDTVIEAVAETEILPALLAHEVEGVLEEIGQYIHALPVRLHAAFKSLIESARNHGV